MNPISETYNMDCMEYMRQFPDKHFQLSIVDPPYGIGHSTIAGKQSGTKYGKAAARKKTYKEKEDRFHPTQKPVALYKWLLSNYAKPGDKILDTHLGSGSSRIAAYDLGFDFYATELDKDYFDAQEKRFQNFKSQLKLF